MSKYAICQCYFTRNFFVDQLQTHCLFASTPQFLHDYADLIRNLGQDELKSILKDLAHERDRRRNLINGLSSVRETIRTNYKRKHPGIFNFQESRMLDERFSELVTEARNKRALDKITHHGRGVFSFPAFTPDFCQELVDELNSIEHHPNLPLNRPNTMNKYGTALDDVGFTNVVDTLRQEFIQPLCDRLYKDERFQLDSHKAFTVKYLDNDFKNDEGLAIHFDNAEVTLNVALTENFDGGEVVFHGRSSNGLNQQPPPIGINHEVGQGILHLGCQLHEALPITNGTRVNLIIWMRSSKHRNLRCPMCLEKPILEEVSCGYGDGFTMHQSQNDEHSH
ncbi:hypothetical protein TCAL_00796 [Tigriopus californicus]|uniref:Fe2OG dioxygenase domain-containing protein n=2 Tax=Tigriopus californicus TaxID=6832 RepID=A0A553NC47_TIGCA|nr:hypothetical protein TCAL_00796 [Tigriopus californicus]|eukprot:TCALIF_00796-PA protein Name:"Similar to ogfod2 2-oxoglutarate and iron-dependent oxygenase domain-containing protein 2 (Danio rerio)" AED:0.01 eAED:0.01 QI:0/-1/0/1/-1/1/1/0/336